MVASIQLRTGKFEILINDEVPPQIL